MMPGKVSQDSPSQIKIGIHRPESRDSAKSGVYRKQFSFPSLDIGPCKVIIVNYFTEQKDMAGVHDSVLFLVLHVVCYQMLASSRPF